MFLFLKTFFELCFYCTFLQTEKCVHIFVIFCTTFVSFGFRSLVFYNLFWVGKLSGVKNKTKQNLSSRTRWSTNSCTQRGGTRWHDEAAASAKNARTGTPGAGQWVPTSSSPRLAWEAGPERLPTERCSHRWETGSDQGEDISGKPSKKGNPPSSPHPAVLPPLPPTPGLRYSDGLKTCGLETERRAEVFFGFDFSEFDHRTRPRKSGPRGRSSVFFRGARLGAGCSVLGLPRRAPWLRTPPSCLKSSWCLVASRQGPKALAGKHHAARRPVSHKTKTSDLDNLYAFFCIDVPIVNNSDRPL